MGFRLNLKWVFPVHSNSLANSPSRVPCSFQGSGASFKSVRLPVISEENVVLLKELLKAHASSSPQTLRSGCCEIEELKVNLSKRLHDSSDAMIGETQVPTGGYTSSSCTSLQTGNSSCLCLLMRSLDVIEEIFDDSGVLRTMRLEKDILLQLGKLGALNLFYTFLSRILKSSNVFSLSSLPTNMGQCTRRSKNSMDSHVGKIVFCSRKKKERKKRREMASESSKKISSQLLQSLIDSSAQGASNSRNRRSIIARNEAEMSKGVKVVANLERIRIALEKQTGRVASLSCWAEAAGVSENMLQQHLHFGWCCRDELLRSTHSLVLYLARNYRGLGIAYKDLIQAGNLGVLQGAEKFDHRRGFKFSTYVQYWIRRSMARMVTQHARGIRLPYGLSRAINKIQKARKALSVSNGKFPQDDGIARFTGLPLAKIKSASKCMRIVGSVDEKVGDCSGAKYLEVLPDTSIKGPEEMVLRQHMKKDIHDLLNGLNSRERQIMILRYGLKDFQPMSLEEIGRHFQVSKEWIRKIEMKAMTKLRDEETCRNLSYYLHLQLNYD